MQIGDLRGNRHEASCSYISIAQSPVFWLPISFSILQTNCPLRGHMLQTDPSIDQQKKTVLVHFPDHPVWCISSVFPESDSHTNRGLTYLHPFRWCHPLQNQWSFPGLP